MFEKETNIGGRPLRTTITTITSDHHTHHHDQHNHCHFDA
jgi:hypothetical protein